MELASVAPCLRSALHQTDDPVMPIPRQPSNDGSTQDPPSPTDEAQVLRVALSTLLPWRLRWLPASEASYMKGDFSGSLPLRSAFIKIGGSLPPRSEAAAVRSPSRPTTRGCFG